MNKKITVIAIILTASILLTGCSSLLDGLLDGLNGAISNLLAEEPAKAYDDLVDHWKKDTVFEGGACAEVYETLMSAAENGDKDTITNCFTEGLRKKSTFSKEVDDFIKAYPKGLKTAEMKYSPAGAGGSFKEGKAVKGAGATYEGVFNGEHYYIYFKVCYCDDFDPSNIGVEFFLLENTGAHAKNNYDSAPVEDYWANTILRCDIRNDVNYRMVNGKPLYWTDTSSPKLTVEEMRKLLTEHPDLGAKEVRNAIGTPNCIIHSSNSAGSRVYYELKPENGEPRYVYISAQSDYGDIYDAYVCTEDSTDYDNPLYSMPRG